MINKNDPSKMLCCFTAGQPGKPPRNNIEFTKVVIMFLIIRNVKLKQNTIDFLI
jgi:hypothetical protein